MPARLFALPLAVAVFLRPLRSDAAAATARPTVRSTTWRRSRASTASFATSTRATRRPTLDWDRFAVHGVTRVRPARDGAELAAALRALAAPLGPGIEIGSDAPAAPR